MARDITLDGDAVDHPGVARLKKSQRWNIVLLMGMANNSRKITWRPDRIAWRLKLGSVERWNAFAKLLIDEDILVCIEGEYYLAEFLFAGHDTEEDDEMPTSAANRTRKPSDEPEETAARKRRQREREAAEAADSEEDPGQEDKTGGVTSEDVTPPAGQNGASDPSRARAVTDSVTFGTKKQLHSNGGNGLRPPDATSRDKSPGGRGKGSQWKDDNAALARQSTQAIGDEGSMGMHILTWNHARTWDQRNGNTQFADLLFDLLRRLTDEYKQTNKPQGHEWTRKAKAMFDHANIPLNLLPTNADPKEIAEAKAALASTEGA